MGITERRKRERLMRQKMIQDAALELFMQKGFHSVKMEDISEKAELSIATIYIYFKSKDELYASLIEIALQYLYDQVRGYYENESMSHEQKLLGYKDALYRTYKEHLTILRIIIHIQLYDTLSTLDRKLLDRLNSLGREIIKTIAETYNQGVAQGQFNNGNGIAHVDILWALFTGLVLWEESKKKIDANKDFLKPTLDKAFDIFCQGIRKG